MIFTYITRKKLWGKLKGKEKIKYIQEVGF